MAGIPDKNRFMKKIQEILECPVCLEVSRTSVRQCGAGHLTCAACASKMTVCCLCQNPILKIKPTCLNNLLEALPIFCENAEKGCKEIIVPGGTNHEDYCGFRYITCRSLPRRDFHENSSFLCGDQINVYHIKEHYEKRHPKQYLFTQMSASIYFRKFQPYQEKTIDTPLFLDGHFFYVQLFNCTRAERSLRVTIEAFFVENPKLDYFFIIEFKRGNFVFIKTIKAVNMKRKDATADRELNVDVKNEGDSHMKVPQDLLCNLIDNNHYLSLTYRCFKF